MDPPTPIELSVFIIFVILFVAVLITVAICCLLRAPSLIPPSLGDCSMISSLIRRFCARSSLGDCSICLTPFHPKDQLSHLPLSFHADCISTWFISNPTCPLCRSPLSVAANTATADVGHDGSRSWLRDLSRGISSRALSFRSSSSFFTGSIRRGTVAVDLDLDAGEAISGYFWWISTV